MDSYSSKSVEVLSTLMSHCSCFSQVDLLRSYTFRNSKGSYKGIPIIAANMDTVGTFEMALALYKVSIIMLLVIYKWLHTAHVVVYHFILSMLLEQGSPFVGRRGV